MAGTFDRPIYNAALGDIATVVGADIFYGDYLVINKDKYDRSVIQIYHQRNARSHLIYPGDTGPFTHHGNSSHHKTEEGAAPSPRKMDAERFNGKLKTKKPRQAPTSGSARNPMSAC